MPPSSSSVNSKKNRLCHHQTYQCLRNRRKEYNRSAWDHALAGDPESAFGGVLVCNNEIDLTTAEAINEFFFEVLIAPSFQQGGIGIIENKKEPYPASTASAATKPV